jgi:invasion protein IalB
MDCSAVQNLFLKQTGKRFISVVVRVPAETKKPKMLVLLPLGTYLPAGVSLQFGREGAKKLAIESCDQSACVAQYDVTEADMATLMKGDDLNLSIQGGPDGKPTTFTVPALGFADAYAKIK